MVYGGHVTSTTIYARVPEQTRQAAGTFATEHGLKLTTALQELIELGLEAAAGSDAVTELQGQVEQLGTRVQELELTIQEQALERLRLERELASLRQAANLWVERADMPVGACPCGAPLNGADVLVAGRCGKCGVATSALIEPKESNLDNRDFMLALGAVGVMLGLVALAARNK